MFMKGFSILSKEDEQDSLAFARAEGIDASYRDLSQVCGRISRKKIQNALSLLEKASEGEVPILFAQHNKKMGHRRELGGRKGGYPKKAAAAVLKVLKSAIANARVKGLGEDELVVFHASANKKLTYPRMSAKGRRMRQDFEVSRIEIVVKGKQSVEKKVTVNAPEKAKSAEVKAEAKPETKSDKTVAKQAKEEIKTEDKKTGKEAKHAHNTKSPENSKVK